jgi:hypothetical protein
VWTRNLAFRAPCGLEEPTDYPRSGRRFAAEEDAFRRALPLGPAQARAALEELLRLGEYLGPDGIRSQASASRFFEETSREEIAGDVAAMENISLPDNGASFPAGHPSPERRGKGEEGRPDGPSLRRMLVDSQKVLLLAYTFEGYSHDAANLEKRFAQAEESLRDVLGEGGSEDDKNARRRTQTPSGYEEKHRKPPISWRVLLEAVFPFLPDNTALLTADAEMIHDLRAECLLLSCPAKRVHLLPDAPEEALRGLTSARAPAWRLVGRRSCPALRPWMQKEYEVLAADAADLLPT